MKLLLIVIAVLTLTGCTATQVNEGMQWAAGEIITTALDIAIGSGKGDEREYDEQEYEQSRYRSCYPFCEFEEEARREADRAQREHCKRRAESRAFKAEFDAYMAQLEETQRFESTSSPVLAESSFSPQP